MIIGLCENYPCGGDCSTCTGGFDTDFLDSIKTDDWKEHDVCDSPVGCIYPKGGYCRTCEYKKEQEK